MWFNLKQDEMIQVEMKKYKIFKVITDLEEEYNIFSDDIEKAKTWVKNKYNDRNPKKLSIKYFYSTDNIDKAKEMAKQVI